MPVKVRFPERTIHAGQRKKPVERYSYEGGTDGKLCGASSGSASSSAPSGATNSAVNGQGGLNTDQTPGLSASAPPGTPKNPGSNGGSEPAFPPTIDLLSADDVAKLTVPSALCAELLSLFGHAIRSKRSWPRRFGTSGFVPLLRPEFTKFQVCCRLPSCKA